jgi:NAD(P)-dependent dehydrogenase (short-subunit alcohol dehydrogenase family)
MVSAASITARRILVTGANRGLGFATALELARRGHELILTARRLEDVDSLKRRMLAQIPHRTVGVHSLDLASFDSIRRFAVSIVSRKAPIQTVLHNAGLVLPPPQRHVTEDGIEESLAVAAVGPLLLSLSLLPVLAHPSRLVGVNSALHAPRTYGDEVSFRFDDPQMESGYTATRAYKNAKLAQLWFLFEWERRFGSQGLHADAGSLRPRPSSSSSPIWAATILR